MSTLTSCTAWWLGLPRPPGKTTERSRTDNSVSDFRCTASGACGGCQVVAVLSSIRRAGAASASASMGPTSALTISRIVGRVEPGSSCIVGTGVISARV
jgi:hypothetical protein